MASVAEDDPMFQLLTDALRAGPGSPAWREAVGALKEQGGAAGDEYGMLLAARERIESGKEWRSVRAGAGFTRKVMEGIEASSGASGSARAFPAAGVIGGIAGVVLIGLVGVGLYLASSSREVGGDGGTSVVADVSGVYFATPVASASFDDLTPTGWHEVGALPLGGTGGLVPTTVPAATGTVGGALVCDTPVRSPVALEVQLRAEKLSDDLIPQVFVTDDATFSEGRGTSGHELVWMAGADGMRVVTPDGRVAAAGKMRAGREPQIVRVVLGKAGAIVELDGRRVWAGEHQLRGDRPWYVGVRFLAKGGGNVRGATFLSARVLKPAGG